MTKVSLRVKKISDKKESLYLDFYPPITNPSTGKPTRREFLGLHINPETITDKNGKLKKIKLNPIDKQHNKETKELAEHIRAKRMLEVQRGDYGFLANDSQQQNFIDYCKGIAAKHSVRNQEVWRCAIHYLEDFGGKNLRFADLNVKFCNDFTDYLLNAKRMRSRKLTISQNSALSYQNKFKAALNQAYDEGLLKTKLSVQFDRIKEAEFSREFLSIEELNRLVKTECTLPLLKTAALFSALTGLRFSDIQKMVWSEVQETSEIINNAKTKIYYIRFTQQKTKGVETLPISEQAFNLLGERGNPKEKVFEGLEYSAFVNFHLKRWLINANIGKNITFHCFRHTFATLQLSKGTDIYTVSKMLGHRELKTTQIYAKIIDQTKREAANKIQLDF
jgi:integrase